MFKFNLKKLASLAIIGSALTASNTYSKIIINECNLRNIASTFWIKPSLSPEYDLVESKISNQELFILNNNYDYIFKPQIQTAIDLTEEALNQEFFGFYSDKTINITANYVVIIKDILKTLLHKKLLLLKKDSRDFYCKCMRSANNRANFLNKFNAVKSLLAKYSSDNPKLYEIARFVFFDLEFNPEIGFFVHKKQPVIL